MPHDLQLAELRQHRRRLAPEPRRYDFVAVARRDVPSRPAAAMEIEEQGLERGAVGARAHVGDDLGAADGLGQAGTASPERASTRDVAWASASMSSSVVSSVHWTATPSPAPE